MANYNIDRTLIALHNALNCNKENRRLLKARLRALQTHFKRGDGATLERIFDALRLNAISLMNVRAEHNRYFLSTFGRGGKGNATPKAKTASNVIDVKEMPDGSELKIYRRGGFLFDAETAEKLATSLAQIAHDLKAAEAAHKAAGHKNCEVRAIVEIRSKED